MSEAPEADIDKGPTEPALAEHTHWPVFIILLPEDSSARRTR